MARFVVRLVSLVGVAGGILWGVVIAMAATPKQEALENIGTYVVDFPAWVYYPVMLWASVAIVIGGIVGLSFSRHTEDQDDQESRHEQSRTQVTSVNQSGGQTAHTIVNSSDSRNEP